MASPNDRYTFVYLAKLAEQAERYDGKLFTFSLLKIPIKPRFPLNSEVFFFLFCLNCIEMVDSMKKLANFDVDLTVEERNLLSVGYKNVIGARRASWRILSSIEQKEESKGNEVNVKRIRDYRHKVESELTDICNDVMKVIDDHLLPFSSSSESTVFYYKM